MSHSNQTNQITQTAAVAFVAACSIAAFHVIKSKSSLPREHPKPKRGVNWESFGFGLNGVRTKLMWLNCIQVESQKERECSEKYSASDKKCLVPLRDLNMSPTATVLNYGQALFEGVKATRLANGSIAIFRPERNAERMAKGATRFLMPAVPTEVFLHAVDAVVRGNAEWVPPTGKGALYVRPLLMGTGEGDRKSVV